MKRLTGEDAPLPEWVGCKVRCKNCRLLFQLEKGDAKFVVLHNFLFWTYWSAVCIDCGESTSFKPNKP